MVDCRDWLKTLWPASFKGRAFYFESDDEEGGRGLVIHKFPHRDDPYVEDLGEEPRFYEGRAYVTGDDADRLAVSLTEMLARRGAGTLVVPLVGPVVVHCQTFKRHHERDKLGYVAFDVKFVREGARSALISIPHYASLAFAAADMIAPAFASVFPRRLTLTAQADHVVAAAAFAAQDALVALDTARLSEPVAPLQSAKLRDAIDAAFDLVPSLLRRGGAVATEDVDAIYAAVAPFAERPPAPSVNPPPATADTATVILANAAAIAEAGVSRGPFAVAFAIIAITRALAEAMPAETAARAMRALAIAHVVTRSTPYLSTSARMVDDNLIEVARLARLAALTAFSEAIVRRTYTSRPEGVSARAEAAARFEDELNETTGAEFASLYIAIQKLRGGVVEFLTRLINDLAPVITIEATRQMPALWWAWRLYAAPERGSEIVARNRIPHPGFVPTKFQTLAR